MHPNAPELSRTYRDIFDSNGTRVVVQASHHTSRRMPTGAQISRMVTRGRPVEMVEHVTHEWAVTADGRRVGTVRPNTNGTFSMSGDHAAHRTLREAAEAPVLRAAKAMAVRAAPEDVAEDSDQTPPIP